MTSKALGDFVLKIHNNEIAMTYSEKQIAKISPVPVAQATMEQHSSTGDSKHNGSFSRLPLRMYGCLQRGEHSKTPPDMHSHVSSQPRSILSPI